MMDNSPDSQPALIWNSVSINNCMWTHTPGRYLLRKSDWKDPKYYTSLTGIWDRSCGRIKLYVTDKEQFLTYDQVQMSKRVTENCEHIKRKGLVQKLKQKSVWYNNLVDSVAVMSLNSRMKKMAVEDYKDVVSNTMDQVNGVIISGYDSFALEKQGDTLLEDLVTTLNSSVLDLQAALLTRKNLETSSAKPVRQTKRNKMKM